MAEQSYNDQIRFLMDQMQATPKPDYSGALRRNEKLGLVAQLSGMPDVGKSLMASEANVRDLDQQRYKNQLSGYNDQINALSKMQTNERLLSGGQGESQFGERYRVLQEALASGDPQTAATALIAAGGTGAGPALTQTLGMDVLGFEGDKKSTINWADFSSKFAQNAGETVPQLVQSLDETKRLREAIEGGAFSGTGPVEGWIGQYTDPEVARMKTMQVMQLLQNLQITRLTPVTEYELKIVSGLFADIGVDPEQNVGRLKAFEDIIKLRLEATYEAMDYYNSHGGTLQGFESKAYEKLKGLSGSGGLERHPYKGEPGYGENPAMDDDVRAELEAARGAR